MTDFAIKAGEVFAGQWRVLLPLEEGPYPSYRVKDNAGRDAELLILPHNPELERAAVALNTLRHENLLTLYQAGEWRGKTFVIREMVMGQTISDWLRRDRRLGYDQALGIACQLCLASKEAAAAGVASFGFDSGNVRITPDGFVKTDPLRLPLGSQDDRYRAPEEARGASPDVRSDVFRIGLLLYEMLSGRLPYRTIGAGISFEPLSPSVAGLSEIMDKVLAKALSDNPDDRYADAEKLLDDLHPLLMYRPAPASARPTRWHEDSRFWLYVAIALTALALILSLATGLLPFPFDRQ
jgi:serine/threonine protein kinase